MGERKELILTPRGGEFGLGIFTIVTIRPKFKMMTRMKLVVLTGWLVAGFLTGETRAEGKRLQVFIMAGQSNMDGQANVSTIDFLGEDPDKERAGLLKKLSCKTS